MASEEDVLIAPIAKGEDKKEPTKTGDNTPAGLYGAIMLTAALGCAFVYRKKTHK